MHDEQGWSDDRVICTAMAQDQDKVEYGCKPPERGHGSTPVLDAGTLADVEGVLVYLINLGMQVQNRGQSLILK